MSVRDGRCDSLTTRGTRCTRLGVFGHHDFAWCRQHLPPDEWEARVRWAASRKDREDPHADAISALDEWR